MNTSTDLVKAEPAPPTLVPLVHRLPTNELIEVPIEVLQAMDQIDMTVDTLKIASQADVDMMHAASIDALKLWQLIDDERKRYRGPFKNAADAIDNFVAPMLNRMKTSQKRAKDHLEAYIAKTRAATEEAAKQEKVRQDLAAGQRPLEGRLISPLMPTPAVISAPQVPTRKVPETLIVNADMLPRKYLIPNIALIEADSIAGEVIPGVNFQYVDKVVSRRK